MARSEEDRLVVVGGSDSDGAAAAATAMSSAVGAMQGFTPGKKEETAAGDAWTQEEDTASKDG